jgi:hypothetical protein
MDQSCLLNLNTALNSKSAFLKLEENISYMGWPNCIRLSNSEVELIITTDIGLRILHFGFISGQNIFYLSPDDKGKQGGGQWRIYGGHRLWHAPEAIPRTYSPDNNSISYSYDSQTLKLIQPEEIDTGISKEMEISLSPDNNEVKVLHRLVNQNQWSVRLSAWAISALAPGGKAIIPQEPYGEGNEYLLPARSMALWSYTLMNDSRWIWGNKFIQAKQDPGCHSEQKIGVLNKQGWASYCMEDEFLIKVFYFDPAKEYPDFNSNNEIYINGNFLELETLGPYLDIPSLGKTEHTECWLLSKGSIGDSEESIEQFILPHVTDLQKRITFLYK